LTEKPIDGTDIFSRGSRWREALVHMIEEYARHVGHVDPPRECIDGRPVQ